MANIVEGIHSNNYTDPVSAGGTAIGATRSRELLTADLTDRQLLVIQCKLLIDILTELRIANEQNFPNVEWDNERAAYDEAIAPDIDQLLQDVDALAIQ